MSAELSAIIVAAAAWLALVMTPIAWRRLRPGQGTSRGPDQPVASAPSWEEDAAAEAGLIVTRRSGCGKETIVLGDRPRRRGRSLSNG